MSTRTVIADIWTPYWNKIADQANGMIKALLLNCAAYYEAQRDCPACQKRFEALRRAVHEKGSKA